MSWTQYFKSIVMIFYIHLRQFIYSKQLILEYHKQLVCLRWLTFKHYEQLVYLRWWILKHHEQFVCLRWLILKHHEQLIYLRWLTFKHHEQVRTDFTHAHKFHKPSDLSVNCNKFIANFNSDSVNSVQFSLLLMI